jgi:hypothetical protein
MSALGFCRECGNLIQKHYHYCPFCGDRQGYVPEPAAEKFRTHPRPDPVTRTRDFLARLDGLSQKLALLDRELDELVEKRPSPATASASVRREIAP